MPFLSRSTSSFSLFRSRRRAWLDYVAICLVSLLLAGVSIAAPATSVPDAGTRAASAPVKETIPQVVIIAKRMTPEQKRKYDEEHPAPVAKNAR